MSTFGFDVGRQRKELNIARWDLGTDENRKDKSLLPADASELESIAEYFSGKPVTIEQDALHWFRENRTLLPDSATDVELKCRSSQGMIRRLFALNDPTLVGIDKTFQQSLLRDHGCEQFFLTIQLLAGICNRWSFLAMNGAASIFSLLTPVNLLLVLDEDNLSLEMLVVRSLINSKNYGIPTIGQFGLKRGFADRVADDPPVFRKTVLAALENKKRAFTPTVKFQEMDELNWKDATSQRFMAREGNRTSF